MPADEHPTSTDFATLVVFALASGSAVTLGAVGLGLHGAAFGTWSRNPAAWFAGMVLGATLILAGRRQGLSAAIIALAIAALVGTLFAPDQSGVNRWIDVGPLHANIAALLLPPAIVALATLGIAPFVFLAVTAGIGALLLAQPDASQATAFLLAAAVIFCRSAPTRALMAGGLLAMAALAATTWLRADPLQPVPEVEGIFPLLASTSSALAVMAALALAGTCLTPLRRRGADVRSAGLALATYFAATALTPLFGAYPVPLVGLGMSFPVGYWLGTALLCTGNGKGPKRGRSKLT